MLDWQLIRTCHAHVPVVFWPVLWVYLLRLEATAARCRAEGRKGFMWHLMPNGVIIVSFTDASRAERARRGELPRDFDRTPWIRHAPLGDSPLWAALSGGVVSRLLVCLSGMAKTIPELYRDHTAVRPCAAPPRPP